MCPVCRARFRGVVICSRCGADLSTVMALVASAWRARQAARRSLAEGDIPCAQALALHAQQLAYTEAGKKLEILTNWLAQG
jgi:predicted amidophosphoribosyltransferase